MLKKWRVLLLDSKKSNPNHYICIAIKEAFVVHPLTEFIIKADYGNAIDRARTNRCNLLVVFDGEELDRGICSRVAAICKTSILWVTEDPYEISVNRENAGLFDLVFTNDKGSVSEYGGKGRHLPFAASQSMHFHRVHSESEDDFYYDVFFAGTAWPNRVDFFKDLQQKSGLENLKLKLILPGNPHIPKPDLNMAPSSYLWKTPNSEFVRFANRSRIILTLHRSFSSSGNKSSAETPGPRLFEIALAGGFQLIDMALPEVTKYFDEGSEFVGFNSPDECIEKLRYYLDNHKERVAITEAAQRRALKEHLYEHRVDSIFSELACLVKEQVGESSKLNNRILFVTHNVLGVQPYGGVEVYQHTIIDSLKDRYQILVYTVDRSVSPLGRKYSLYDENGTVLDSYSFETNISDVVLSCPDRERVFSAILTRYEINLVHFQHLIGHCPSLPFISKSLGVPSIFSLHDYYAVCRHFNLIGYQNRYCNIPDLPSVSCDVCLNAKDRAVKGSQAIRRAFFARVFEQVDVLHANTKGIASIFEKIFPSLRIRQNILVHGVPVPSSGSLELASEGRCPTKQLHVAIIGNFNRVKGADVLIHAFNQMREDPVKFFIFGSVSQPYNEILDHLNLPNVEIHGEYSAGTIANQLKTMSLSLHVSIWPETYCITLSEAWQAGIIPIVSDIGALGERVTHGVNGFKVPVEEPGPIISTIRLLISQPSLADEVRAQISSDLFSSKNEHVEWLNTLYERLIESCKIDVRLPTDVFPETKLSLLDSGTILNQNVWLKTHDALQVETVIKQSSQKYETRFSKLLKYNREHGYYATAKRIAQVLLRLSFRSNGTI